MKFMKKYLCNTHTIKRLMTCGLGTVILTVLVDTVMIRRYEHRLAKHAAAPTFTVCHAVEKPHSLGTRSYPEKYLCSNEGCYSDEVYDMSVVGAYQDGNTCAGIAKNLQEGITSE